MSKRSHISFALTAAAAALAFVPASSQAATVKLVHYDVTAEATLKHKHGYLFTTSWEQFSSNVDVSSKLHAKIGRVTFRDGHLMTEGQGPATADSTGTAKGNHVTRESAGSRSCTAAPGPRPSGEGALVEEEVTPLGAAGLRLRVADRVEIDWTCTGDEIVGAKPSYELTDNPEVGKGPLDAEFSIPHEAIGYGKIIQNIAGPGGGFCAGSELPHTTKCEYGWTGQVTLTKTSETVISDVPEAKPPAEPSMEDLLVPLVPPAPKGEPSMEDLLVPLVPSAAAKADAKGSTVSFTASCPSGCSGSAALTVGAGAKASAAAKRRKPTAMIRFNVKAGKPRTVKLRLPKKAARALRRAGRGSLAVTLKPRRGKGAKRTIGVKVARR